MCKNPLTWNRALTAALALAAVAFAGVSVNALRAGGVQSADASHPWNPSRHLTVQHFASAYEQYCVWVMDSSTTHNYAYTTISNILYNNNPSGDWDSLAWDYNPGQNFWRIYFAPIDGLTCYPSAYGEDYDVQYRVQTSHSNCGSVNCVEHWTASYNSAWGHWDYKLGIAYIRTNGLYPHAVNHETGHVLGLKDPNFYGDCPSGGSIMHSIYYGCGTDYAYPTAPDRTTVENISSYAGP